MSTDIATSGETLKPVIYVTESEPDHLQFGAGYRRSEAEFLGFVKQVAEKINHAFTIDQLEVIMDSNRTDQTHCRIFATEKQARTGREPRQLSVSFGRWCKGVSFSTKFGDRDAILDEGIQSFLVTLGSIARESCKER